MSIPPEGVLPNGFEPISKLYALWTPSGKREVVDWECYIMFANGKPTKKRTTPWYVGILRNPLSKSVEWNLHDIGAQHRKQRVYLRPVRSITSKSVEIYLTWNQHKKLAAPGEKQEPVKSGDYAGFYLISDSDPHPAGNGFTYWSQFDIITNDPELRIEVFFERGKPSGEYYAQQLEDGGPPPVPPSAMEN